MYKNRLLLVGAYSFMVIMIVMWHSHRHGRGVTVPLFDYVNVYTIGNRLVRQDVYYKHALLGLPTGVYIVGGQKVFWNNRR